MAKKLWIENNSIPAVLWQEEQPTGDWLDKTNDAESWDLYGKYVMDYLFYRDKINTILFAKANPNLPTIDFSGFFTVLTANERLLMCKYVLAPYALRTAVVSDEIDYQNWDILLEITQGLETNDKKYTGRALLIEKMRRHVAHKVRKELMTMADSQSFYKDCGGLTTWYIRAACPDFKQWITNEVGSAYENDGFAQKTYYSETLMNELMSIYNGG